MPNPGRFVVVLVDRHAQPFGRDAKPLLVGQKLPGPVDRLLFEVVAETEIAQHLEERVVIRRPADVVDVAGAQALLAGRGAREIELHLAQKMVLELVHSGRCEQHRRIPGRHQHIAGAAGAAFGFKELEVFFA